MQRLPYVVVTNPHISDVYDLYYTAFDLFRRVKEIQTLDDNDQFCAEVAKMLRAHNKVIPQLAMGVVECSGMMDKTDLDHFMNVILRSRISRRVIAEQHLALTDTFHSSDYSPGAKLGTGEGDFIGEVLSKCVAKDVIERCGAHIHAYAIASYGNDVKLPEVRINGHLDAAFPYILSHLEYIVGELLRNSVQAVVEKHKFSKDSNNEPPPIEVTLCEAAQHVIIRVSDQGGGIPRPILPYLWSFSKGPQSDQRLENMKQVPFLTGTFQELKVDGNFTGLQEGKPGRDSSLGPLSTRPPGLRLGMGLPLSRVYAEYWAGSLELHSLEGYGVDAFLQISKLGNKNEQLATRAMVDAV
jgi:pyruvate dehydrogenase kinase 2/3/4